MGSSYSQLTALDGRLYLGFNDYYVDNSFQGSTSSREVLMTNFRILSWRW